MTDWQKGDLALCVHDQPMIFPKPCGSGNWRHRGTQVRKGEIYTVDGLGVTETSDRRPRLIFVCGRSGLAIRFRKIRPSAIKHIEALKDVPLPVREREDA